MWQYKADIPETHYQNQCVRLLLQKLGAILFSYELKTDTMSFRLVRGGMQAREIGGFRRSLNAEMPELAFAGRQPAGDLAQ